MLSTDKIKDLLSHGENKQVEFKKCTDKVSASVYETVCSFLNAEGGYIFLGLPDAGDRRFAIPADDGRGWLWSC